MIAARCHPDREQGKGLCRKCYDAVYYRSHTESIKRRVRAYEKTPKGIAVKTAGWIKYRKSEKCRIVKRRYKMTAKGKVTAKRADRSEAGKARHRRYLQTSKGRTMVNIAARRCGIKKRFGLTMEQYDALLLKQNKRCSICLRHPCRLVLDHCHKRGKSFRGFLCTQCNVGLGMLQDSPDVLRAAIAYIKKHQKNAS